MSGGVGTLPAASASADVGHGVGQSVKAAPGTESMFEVRCACPIDSHSQGGQHLFSPGPGSTEPEVSGFRTGVLDGDLQVIFRQAFAHPAGPFDQAQPVRAVKIFLAADGKEFIGPAESPGIKVCDWNATVCVQLQQHERGAVDLLVVDTQSTAQRAGKVRLSGAQFAIKCDRETGRQLSSEGFG